MWDRTQIPVCVWTENHVYFTLQSHAVSNVSTGHSEFWQDSVAILPGRGL
jgi:hypothetical protein